MGQKTTEALILQRAKQWPEQYDAGYIAQSRRWIGRRAADCAGLIKAAYMGSSGSIIKYDAAMDYDADGMFDKATVGGPVTTIPEFPGVCVWLPGHVGVYIGDGYVIEARGVDYGVVKTALKSRPWQQWFYCPFVDYTGKEEDDMATIINRIAEAAGLSEDEAISALGTMVRLANRTEEAWEREGVQYLLDKRLITAKRDGREPVEFGELGVIIKKIIEIR